jgi:hypothetical protein
MTGADPGSGPHRTLMDDLATFHRKMPLSKGTMASFNPKPAGLNRD